MTGAAIYCRISSDRSGEGLGVDRQARSCRELAAGRGWDVVEVLTDNDASAYSGKPRPAYDRLLAGVEAGEYDAVVAYAADRLYRHPKDLERFVDTVDRAKVPVATCSGGDVDLTTPDGRAVARVLGALARAESEKKAKRHADKSAELARDGRANGGGRRAYADAAMLTELVHRVAAGESMSSLQAWANAEHPRERGGTWTVGGLRNLVLQPRLAGYRQHQPGTRGGRVRRNTNARLYEGDGPRLCDRDEWHLAVERFGFGVRQVGEALRYVSLVPSGKRVAPIGSGEAHLLAGVVRCECGTAMQWTAAKPKRRVPARYACPGCWSGVPADVAEAWVLEHVRVATPDEAERERAVARVEELQERRRRLTRLHLDGRIDGVDFDAEYDALAEELALAETAATPRTTDTPRGAVLRSGMTVTVQRLRHEHARPFRTREVEENDRNHLAGVPKKCWSDVTVARLTVAGSAWEGLEDLLDE